MEKYTLKNGIQAVFTVNAGTPRTAAVMYAGINKNEKITGLYYLTARMLFQGTKNRTSAELAFELEENAIDISIDKKADYMVFKLCCLNEDIGHGFEILQDIIENTTFDDFEKEIAKIKGEFQSDLDSAKVQAQDNYYRTVFKNHPYGAGRKEIMEALGSVTKQDLTAAFDEIKYKMPKNISIAGSIGSDEMKKLLETHFASLKISENNQTEEVLQPLEENRTGITAKEDANQAQIFKGWIIPPVKSADYPAFVILNAILGSSGLSSRLFLELREKQGLAYTVRSVLEPFISGGSFYVYIATEPKNITVSLNGFEKEINKIINEPVSADELENAKNNALGRRQFYTETNLMEASLKGFYEFAGLGADYEDKLAEALKNVTSEDVKQTAEKYLSRHSALSVLAPEKYLKAAELIK